MDDLLAVDEMACSFNLVQCHLKIVVPGVESLVGELLALVDCYDASEAVDLGSNTPIDNHVAKFVLSALN